MNNLWSKTMDYCIKHNLHPGDNYNYIKKIMEEKEALLIEIVKLKNILSTWGNQLVPGYDDKKEVHANEKIIYCVETLRDKYDMSNEEIWNSLEELGI